MDNNNKMNYISELSERTRNILAEVKLVNPSEILTYSIEKFLEKGLTEDEIETLNFVVSKSIFNGTLFRRAAELMFLKCDSLSFGCCALDAITKGGIQSKGITELSGEAGSGKSQMSMQLAINVQLEKDFGGFNKGAIYICTEAPFPIMRLIEIIKSTKRKYTGINCQDLSNNIFIKHIFSANDLLFCVSNRIPKLMERRAIGLIVIDSVGAIFRTESNFKKRANDMRQLHKNLILISNKHHCIVLCINQMTDELNGSDLVPCLGIAWSSLLRTRFVISRSSTDANQPKIRTMHVCFAPNLPQKSAKFQITSDGIVDI